MYDAVHAVWEDAGSPSPAKEATPAEGECYWCGRDVEGMAVAAKDVCGAMFGDHDSAMCPTSDWVCVPCTVVMSGKPPLTYRMWSVVYRSDRVAAPSHEKADASLVSPHVHLCGKNDLTEVVDILLAPPSSPWACTLADSGKIHTLPFARLNHGDGWTIRFERFDVASSSAELANVLHHQAHLYDAGFPKESISTGHPSVSQLARCGINVWREHMSALQPYRGGAVAELALFLLRKDNLDDLITRTRQHAHECGCGPRDRHYGEREHEQNPATGLVGEGKERPRNGGSDGRELAAPHQQDVQEAPDRESRRAFKQLSLFN